MRVAWVVVIAGCGFQAQPVADDGSSAVPDGGAAFDYARCPATYNADLPGPSRYRLIIDGRPAWEQSDACMGDMSGATHLVVLDSQDELVKVAALVNAPPMGIAGNAIWIGAVQLRSATRPGDGWIWFDGATLTSGWHSGEPNDGGGPRGEGDHSEQFIKLQQGRTYYTDAAGSDSNGALCECDGKPIAKPALDEITAYRPRG
jgi:hypothetical protein